MIRRDRLPRVLLIAALTLSVLVTFNPTSSAQETSAEHLLVYGNGFAERLLEAGYFEAYLQSQGSPIKLRSLALNGDQLHHRARPFGVENHMRELLKAWRGDKVLLCFGINEALDRMPLDEFERHLRAYVRLIADRHPNAELVFVTPIAFEDTGDPNLPDAREINARLSDYVERINRVCETQRIRCIDLLSPSLNAMTQSESLLTTNGLYLNEHGNRVIGFMLAQRFLGRSDLGVDAESDAFANLTSLIRRKDVSVKDAFHPTNAVHYYGVRARAVEYKAEISHHLALADLLDNFIWEQAVTPSVLPMPELPTKQAEPVGRPPRKGLGTLKTVEADLKDFTVADGFELNLFASSEEFPELINPLQMAIDKRGRLWVATFGTYPVPVPGREPTDRLLIFEDTDGDGKADTRTVFADKLLLPDGFAFHKDGVIVSVPWKLLWLRDTDGDDHADTTVELVRGLDNTDSHHGGFLSYSVRGELIMKEGVFHRAQFETPWGVVRSQDQSILSFDVKRSRVTLLSQPAAPNPWRIAYNRYGDGFHMFGGGQINDMGPNDIYTPIGYTLPGLGQPFRDDKGSTLEIPSGVNFPEAWRDGLLTGHLLGENYVLYTPMELRDGAYSKSGDSLRLVESSNKSFRPVDMVFGLDGALLISDFYYPIIGHAQHEVRDENRDHAHGRIYRVVQKDMPLSKPPTIVGAEIPELFGLLGHPQIRARELARMEIGERAEHDRESVLAELRRRIAAVLTSGSTGRDGTLRLELLWLCERIEAYDDTRLIEAMLGSGNVREQSMAVRSLRYWANALGESTSSRLLQSALASEQLRVGVQAISSLSHLQREHEWAEAMVLGHQPSSPTLQRPLNEARKFRLPPATPTYPILEYDKTTRLTTWLPSDLGAVTYFKAAKSGQAAMLFTDGKFSQVRLNESIIHGTAATHARTTSIRVTLQAGINKLEVAVTKRQPKRKSKDRVSDPAPSSAALQMPDVQTIYLTDELGKRPDVELPKNATLATHWSGTFGESLESNWLSFARKCYASNCMACHSTDGTRRVGPTFQGLVGKKQSVLDAGGGERQVVVDEAYIRNAILNPLAEYPKDSLPLMPKLQLTKIEVDYLTRFVVEQQTVSETESSPVRPALEELLASSDLQELAIAARATGDAQRGAKLFFKESLSCAKCHDPTAVAPLGPDLAAKRDGVNDVFLVESLLFPSKVISKGFEPIVVVTEGGVVRTGFQVSEDRDTLVLREANTGKELEIPKAEIANAVPGNVSVMPSGLVNQLADRNQFLDLVRFLMDVNEGGPHRFESLKKSLHGKSLSREDAFPSK